MNPIVTISNLFKSLKNLTSIIVGLFTGLSRTVAFNTSSMLSFGNISRKNLVDNYTLYYICQEFENPALIGNSRDILTRGGYNPVFIKNEAVQNTALLHLYAYKHL
jgi:hypothetical protein